jgi:drug/metabolite transporter (DMT)-like permease
MAVVIVPLLDYFLRGKKLLPREIIGVLMAVGGVAFLELGGGGIGTWSFGDLCSLIQPLAFGIGFWRMERGMRLYPNEASRSTAAQIFAVFMASSLYCGVTDTGSINLQQVISWVTDPIILGALVWTGVVTTALTVWMETTALKTLSAAETTLIFSTEPLWGTAFASIIMGEHLGLSAAAGALLIVAGCIFSNLGVDGLKQVLTKQDPASKVTYTGLLSAFGGFLVTLSGASVLAGETMIDTISNEIEAIEYVEEVISSASESL